MRGTALRTNRNYLEYKDVLHLIKTTGNIMNYKAQGDGDRIDQIVRVDTAALLGTIRELESSLSEYHRQDIIPPWATGLISRLDRIEQGQLQSHAYEPRPADPSISLDSINQDDRVMNKMRSMIDSELGVTRISLESRINSQSLELDRLHKLLHIRPTTSEFQQVVLSVNDIQRKMYDSLSEISTSIRSTVKDKVSAEMDSLIDQLQNAEKTQQDGIGVVMKKVEALSDDLASIKSGVENGIGSVKSTVDAVKEDTRLLQEEVHNLRDQREADNAATQYALTEVRFSQDIQRDTLADYKVAVSNSISRLEQTIRSSEENVNKVIKDVDERAAKTLSTVMEAKDAIKDFKLLYEFDVEDIKVSVRTATEMLESSNGRIDSIEGFLLPLQEMHVDELVKRMEETLAVTAKKSEALDGEMKLNAEKVENISKSLATVEHTLNTKIPDQMAIQLERIDQLRDDVRSSEEAITILDALLKQLQQKVGEFSVIRNDMDLIKEQIGQADNRIKTLQSNMAVIMDSNIEHERRLDLITENMEKSEEDIVRRMDEVKESLLELLTEKQAEIDADVKNLRENMEALGFGNESSQFDGGSGFGGRGEFSGAGPMNGGPNAGQGPRSSRMPLSRQITRSGPGLQSHVSGVVITVEEEKAVSQGQAEFMAELCINFEEIAVQKTLVPELPPSMCEQIAATSQSLTAFMATCSDAEIVQNALRSIPHDMVLEDENIVDRRQQKMDTFAAEVMAVVAANNPQPGIIRFEAREKFEKQLKKALTMCMSKHNQVLAVGSTRLGRIKIPSCIACDRPLLDKVRMDTVTVGRTGERFSGPGSLLPIEDELSYDAQSPGQQGRTKFAQLRGFENVKELRLVSSSSKGARNAGPGPEQTFVMRGGFKMPKQDRLSITLAKSESLTPLPSFTGADDR